VEGFVGEGLGSKDALDTLLKEPDICDSRDSGQSESTLAKDRQLCASGEKRHC